MGSMTTAVSVGQDGQVRMYLLWGWVVTVLMGTMTTAVSVGQDGQVRMYLLWGWESEVFLAYLSSVRTHFQIKIFLIQYLITV